MIHKRVFRFLYLVALLMLCDMIPAALSLHAFLGACFRGPPNAHVGNDMALTSRARPRGQPMIHDDYHLAPNRRCVFDDAVALNRRRAFVDRSGHMIATATVHRNRRPNSDMAATLKPIMVDPTMCFHERRANRS